MFFDYQLGWILGIYILHLVVFTLLLLNSRNLDPTSRGIRIAIMWLLPVIGLVIVGLDYTLRRLRK